MKHEVSKKTVHITELISATIVTVTGIFLLLAGLNVFSFPIEKCLLISIYLCFFAISLVIAIMQKNMIGVCFTWAFALLILAQSIVLMGYGHRVVYPIYIAALPIGIFNAAIYINAPKLCKVMAALAIAALMLFLESSELLPIGAVLPIISVYFGIIGIIYAGMRLHKTRNSLE